MNYVGIYVQDAWTRIAEPDAERRPALGSVSAVLQRSGVISTTSASSSSARVCGARCSGTRPVGVIFEGDPGYPGNAVSEKYLASFAPRLAAVWDPRGDARMTLRAAWGRFFDLPHIWNFLGFDRGTPFGTELTINERHVRRAVDVIRPAAIRSRSWRTPT